MTFSSTFASIYYLLAGIIGIALLITIHELGHFAFAKLAKIRTPSFSIGFGPALFQKKIGETNFKISAIPLGGYVEISGMEEVGQGKQEEARNLGKDSFAVKPYYQKMLVVFGGIIFNLLFAYLALILLFSFGIPKSPLLYPLNINTTLENVAKDSPAEKAGLKIGDVITEFNHVKVENDVPKLLELISEATKETPIDLKFKRNDIEEKTTIKIIENPTPGKGKLGVGFQFFDIPPKSFKDSFYSGITYVNKIISQMVSFVISLFKYHKTDGVGGPIMIIDQIKKSAQQGFKIWLLLLILISINLAVLNLIPLPILDGGQALLITIEAIIRRQIPVNIKLWIQYITWILMLALILYFSIKDVRTLLKW